MTALPDLDWIAVDWGTSNLRAWAMSRDGRALAEGGSDKGMGTLDPDGFEPALLDVAGPWLDGAARPVPVVVCGMAGARQGWAEAPYAPVPCVPLAATAARPATSDPRIDVSILGGLRQDRPADVIRGEETQIAGFLTLNPKFDGVVCLPGTHTKWALLSAGEVVSFRTAMTGEMFRLLADRSVLRHGLSDGAPDADAFATAVGDALSRPEALAVELFGIRAAGLLRGMAPEAARGRLSGLLIGAELAAMRPYWLGQQVAVIGAAGLSALYLRALRDQGLAPVETRGDAVTLAGLVAARARLKEPTP